MDEEFTVFERHHAQNLKKRFIRKLYSSANAPVLAGYLSNTVDSSLDRKPNCSGLIKLFFREKFGIRLVTIFDKILIPTLIKEILKYSPNE